MDKEPKHPAGEPEVPDPYESLIRWQHGAEAGSPNAEEAKLRLFALLAIEVTKALDKLNTTTAALGRIAVALERLEPSLHGIADLLTRSTDTSPPAPAIRTKQVPSR